MDAVDEIRKLTGGQDGDVYVEATGHPAAVEQGLHLIRKLGAFVALGRTSVPRFVSGQVPGAPRCGRRAGSFP